MISARIEEVLALPYGRVLPIAHPRLRAFSQNVGGRPAIVIDYPGPIDAYIDGSRGVRVVNEQRGLQQTYLRFESESEGASALFAALVETLLTSSAEASEEDALARLLAAFEDFKLLLASRRGRLSENAVRGLFAELVLIEQLLDSGLSNHEAMLAWHGPFGAAKDFVLSDNRSIEVKSIRRLLHRVRITSVDQLDPRGDDLTLAVLVLDQRVDGGGESIIGRIRRLRNRLDGDLIAQPLFEDALAALDLDETDDYYASWRFDVGEWSAFEVRDGFPRIRLEEILPGVLDVTFRLDVDHLADFAVAPPWERDQ